ncbi:MAG: fused MFS/spermidine synthase [Pirellulales bacterium]|nr:fused MFS/spermidine synthase [Pirellulales bacterium]
MAAKQKPKPRASAAPELKPAPAIAPDDQRTAVALIPAAGGLNLLVFVSGAVLMGLEIVGSRILAPYFGNSVFVWGSLISLFLIALSLGYFIGGWLSDRWPSRALMNGVVLAVAALMMLIAAVAAEVGSAVLAAGFGEKSGPFLAATILFLLPSLGMGMVSPFAVRLATQTVASVGRVAGTLYALSTLGSIAGTMLTTFMLIPSFGATAILKGLAAALGITAIATFPFASLGAAARGSAAALVALALGWWSVGDSRAALPPGATLVRDVATPYHHIAVIDDRATGTRQLRFDRFTESSIELAPPHRTRSAYTEYFHLAFLAQPDIRRTLFIGAGGGVGPRAFHAHDPHMDVDVVDIDQAVLDVARLDFYLEESPRIRTIAADGRTFVRSAPDGHYDCIILDAFTIGGRIPFHLVTRQYFELCRRKLAPGGVFVMNINSAVRGPASSIFLSIYKTIDSAFPHTYAFALGLDQGLGDQSTNIVLVAVDDQHAIAAPQWKALADQYQSASYVDRASVQRMVSDLVTAPPDTTAAPLFTDDYAPIETMSFESP